MSARAALLVAVVGLLPACTVGPDYERPAAPVAAAFKELGDWKPAAPADELPRDGWWRMFGDAELDRLEQQLAAGNLQIAVAEANYRGARAALQLARAGELPTVGASASATRARASGSGATSTTYALGLDASWEPDLWGRVRRAVEAGAAEAQASAADLASARLSAQAALAADYLQLRTAEAQQALLEDTVAAYARSLQMVQNRQAQGVAAKADVVQAQAQLEGARAQAIDLGVQRAQLEHAIAVLLGAPPADLTLAPGPLAARVPVVPPGLPSTLLERRPDVAAAERRVAAANARVGVAEAAFYPSLTLNAAAGFRATDLSHWLTAPARFWSFGPSLVQTLFDHGARSAASDAARAVHDAEVFSYRQTVLDAFAEVEDQLAALRLLEREAAVQELAVQAARESLAIAQNQYAAGTVSYLDVVTVQSVALADARAAVAIQGRRLLASVLLVKALGGGFDVRALATGD